MSNEADPFKAAILRWTDRFDRLSSLPIQTVSGVIAPSGTSGGSLGAGSFWVLTSAFEGWRIADSSIQTSELAVCKKVTEDELRLLMNQLGAYSVVEIRARVGTDPTDGKLTAELVELVGPSSDQELQEFARCLHEPVTTHHERFGTFTLDRRIDTYEAEVVWNDVPIRLSVDAADASAFSKALKVAGELFDEQEKWKRRIDEFAVAELLPLKNESWLEEGELELNRDDFLGRMTLEAISVSGDGHFDFWHDDGDLFCGHIIQVYGELAKGPTGADIPG